MVFTSKPAFNGGTKDVLTITSKSDVIEVHVQLCMGWRIGGTIQCLDERIKQHVPPSLLQDPPVPNKKDGDSAITRNLKANKACIPKEQPAKRFEILAVARNSEQLNVLEALLGTFCKTKIAIFVKARGRGAKKWVRVNRVNH